MDLAKVLVFSLCVFASLRETQGSRAATRTAKKKFRAKAPSSQRSIRRRQSRTADGTTKRHDHFICTTNGLACLAVNCISYFLDALTEPTPVNPIKGCFLAGVARCVSLSNAPPRFA